MPDHRVFCAPTESDPRELVLSAEESHHLVIVNRARRGDPVVAFNGHGREWSTELAVDKKNEARLLVRSSHQREPLPFHITLGQALPKGPSMDAIVRKATEIGAACILPLETERTQVHLDGGRQDKKVEKWQTAALEAAKQCGNPWLPEIRPVMSVEALFQPSNDFDLKLVASLHPGARSLKTVLAEARAASGKLPHRVLWLVGPEGDFSPAEMARATVAGFVPVTLGPLVLRCETAATYALSVLSYELLNG